MPAGRGKSRMKRRRGDRRPQDCARRRPHEMVERIANLVRRKFFHEVEMCHLAERMHAGVGAPGAVQRDGFAAELFDRPFQNALDRLAAVLTLPAHEIRAVIFNENAIPRHRQPNTMPGGKAKPRKTSLASIADFPGRCRRVKRTAPSPQAMVSASSRMVPGAPDPDAGAQLRILVRSPFTSLQAPGKGDKPRIRQSTSRAGLLQSMRASSFAIFFA